MVSTKFDRILRLAIFLSNSPRPCFPPERGRGGWRALSPDSVRVVFTKRPSKFGRRLDRGSETR